MSAINIATQIPNSISTLEQLAAWVCITLAYHNPDVAVLETNMRSEKVAQMGVFTAADKSERLLLRLSLELKSDFVIDARKLWMSVEEVSQTQIGAAFTSN